MKFWKRHEGMRLIFITVFFVIGLVLVILGWRQTGSLVGLGIMLVGVVLLLAALMIYNKAFQD